MPPLTALAAGGCPSLGSWLRYALGTRRRAAHGPKERLPCGRETRPTLLTPQRSACRFTDPRNPPCFAAARVIEEQRITQWIQEAYDAHRGDE